MAHFGAWAWGGSVLSEQDPKGMGGQRSSVEPSSLLYFSGGTKRERKADYGSRKRLSNRQLLITGIMLSKHWPSPSGPSPLPSALRRRFLRCAHSDSDTFS